MDLNNQVDIKYVSRIETGYPARLRSIPGKPKGLYYIGKLPHESSKSVAVIGARNCSEYGKKMAQWFGAELGAAGVEVISGMARGIDGLSQLAALEAGGNSYAVLGSGVDICYPKENSVLYKRLMAQGGILSEYEPGTPARARQFPPRNRIISGLADWILVIEANIKSGTSITVDMALEQGRDICVLPGRVTDPLSLGCNRLIMQGALMVTSPSDLLDLLGISEPSKQTAEMAYNVEKRRVKDFELSTDEQGVYQCIDFYAKHIETIANESSFSVCDLFYVILSLELKGLIQEQGKNYYVRK